MPDADDSAGSGRPSLADKINRLFDQLLDEHGPRSNDEVAEAITGAGTKISASYLWLLRTGRRDNPGKQHLEAIAQYFQVPPAYFFDDRLAEQIDAELELMGAMRKAGVRELALRAADLSPDSVRAIAAMVEQARKVERLGPGRPDPT